MISAQSVVDAIEKRHADLTRAVEAAPTGAFREEGDIRLQEIEKILRIIDTLPPDEKI